MAVSGAAERNKDCCAAGSGDFRSGEGTRATDDQVGPGKAFGHVVKERYDLSGRKFFSCVGSSYRVVVALAGLVDNVQFILTRSENVHRVDKYTVDGQRPL